MIIYTPLTNIAEGSSVARVPVNLFEVLGVDDPHVGLCKDGRMQMAGDLTELAQARELRAGAALQGDWKIQISVLQCCV